MGSSSGTGGLGLALSGGSNSGGLGPVPGTGSCTSQIQWIHHCSQHKLLVAGIALVIFCSSDTCGAQQMLQPGLPATAADLGH